MSYALTPYLVDLPQIRSLVGSRDESVLAALVATDPEHLAYSDANAEAEDTISLGDALRDLVLGREPKSASAHQYGYALEVICRQHGEVVFPDLWGGAGWEAIEACGLESILSKTGSPVPLPPIGDFPVIAHLRRDEIPAYLSSARQRKEAVQDDDLVEMLEEYAAWLEKAQAKNKDLVLIYA